MMMAGSASRRPYVALGNGEWDVRGSTGLSGGPAGDDQLPVPGGRRGNGRVHLVADGPAGSCSEPGVCKDGDGTFADGQDEDPTADGIGSGAAQAVLPDRRRESDELVEPGLQAGDDLTDDLFKSTGGRSVARELYLGGRVDAPYPLLGPCGAGSSTVTDTGRGSTPSGTTFADLAPELWSSCTPGDIFLNGSFRASLLGAGWTKHRAVLGPACRCLLARPWRWCRQRGTH